MLFVSEFSCGSLRILRSGKEYNAHITHKGECIMRDRIISNVLIKMGNRIKKKELDYLENVLVEEFRDVQIKKESTELTEYNDSLRKLKDTFLATLIVENKSNRTIEQYNLHLTQFVDYFTAKEAKDMINKTDKSRSSYYNYYTNKQFGAASSYNLCVDSSKLGIDGAAKAIIQAIAIFDSIKNKLDYIFTDTLPHPW